MSLFTDPDEPPETLAQRVVFWAILFVLGAALGYVAFISTRVLP